MKFKLMDLAPIYLAGVIHYGSLEQNNYEKVGKEDQHKKAHAKFDKDGQFDKDIAAIRENAYKIRDQVKKEMNFHTNDAEDAFESIGKAVGNFGKFVEKNAPVWESGIKDWGQNFEGNMEDFGKKMESWGEDLGTKMEAWGENIGHRMGQWGESFGDHWDKDYDEANPGTSIKRYPIYRTFEEVYNRYIDNHPDLIKHQTFYEVQILDASYENVTSMVMVGSRMSSLEQMRYPVATMTFEPDRWVAVKLTKEEFAKDWLGSLEKVPQLQPYTIEPYFIIRHKKEGSADEIRLFCPISERVDEK